MNRIRLLAFVLTLGLSLSFTGCRTISRLIDGSGTVYVVEIETNDPNRLEIINRVIQIINSRMNAVGIDGEVARSTDIETRIEVKIYGGSNPESLRKFLFTTYRLELKKLVSPPSPSPPQTFPTQEKADIAALTGQQVLPYSERESGPSQFVIVEKESIVTGEHIRTAQAVSRTGSPSDYQISFTLDNDGAAKFGEWTGRNISNYLAVVLDDKVQSVAFIKTQISDAGEISGSFTKASAEEIAMSLNSGYMPATMKIIDERPFK